MASLLSFVVGLTVMGFEICLARLVAPYFGTTTVVWGGLIAFVLACLAVGSGVGGRVAVRAPSFERIALALSITAAWVAFSPAVASRALQRSSEALLAGDLRVFVAGVVAFVVLASLPLIVLGAVNPCILRATFERSRARTIGELAGTLGAAGNVGSIAGVLLASFVGIPLLGTSHTIALLAVILALVSLPLLRRRVRGAVSLAPAAALIALSFGEPRHAQAIDAIDSPYGLVQTLRDANGLRLVIDQDYATQSVSSRGEDPLPTLFDDYGTAAALVADRDRPLRVLLLGLGGGTAARTIRGLVPGSQIVGVEIDPAVVTMAERHFGLPRDLEIHVEDARTFVARDRREFDLILLDAFRFPYVPFHLATREMMELTRARLAAGGLLVVNVGRYGEERAVVRAVGSTVATVFPEVWVADVANHSNSLVYAGERGLEGRMRDHAGELEGPLRLKAARVLHRMVRARHDVVFTDNDAPIEYMTDAILLRALVERRGVL